MKEYLKKLIASKEAKAKELREQIKKSEDLAEVRALGDTLEALLAELNDAKAQLEKVDEPADESASDERSKVVLGAMTTRAAAPTKKGLESEEYRKAFMEYVCRNTTIPTELRADATTTSTSAGAAIPTTLLNEIVKGMKTYGKLYARVRKLNIQGGVNIPILTVKPTASWISADTATSESDKKALTANTYVSFSYYGLECKISQTLLVNVVTYDAFQELFVELALEAMAQALDKAIVAGTGVGEPLGIAVDTRVPNAQKVTITPANFGKWDVWKKHVFAKIPAAYRNGVFLMAQGTFDGYVDGMVGSDGQPIARVNYGIADGETYRFGGKEVLIVEDDVIKPFDSATGHASTGDVVAIYVDLNDYAINSNLELRVEKWIDYNTNEICNKAIMVCDGKLVDPNSVVIVRKGAAS